MSQQPTEDERPSLPQLEWNDNFTQGPYANTFFILGTPYEVTLDFGFRTFERRVNQAVGEPRQLHVGRVIMSRQAARELRDLLIKNIHDESDEEDSPKDGTES